jgi:hypothetical protein
MEKMKNNLHSEWEVTNLREPTKIVGIEITHTENSITISQKQYIETILKREGLEQANPVSMPMDLNIKLQLNSDGNEGNHGNSYVKVLRKLQFLANTTRLDIAFAVNRLMAYTANPSLQHVGALKWILKYLAGTHNHGITYFKIQSLGNLFHGYADTAYANVDDCKSTSGYVYIMAGGAIMWRSKKQTMVALSSTEAEYISLSEAGHEACLLRRTRISPISTDSPERRQQQIDCNGMQPTIP